ncbi:MAG: hypothetical protein JXA95_03955 [Spirochaetales bacterium]|nr:hypothetical protein [Spirochaetales bacterium]
MKKVMLILILTVIAGSLTWGESLLTLDMKLLQAVSRSASTDEWSYGGTGTADLTVKSTGNRNVKGELSLVYIPMDGLPAGTALLSLDKASIKVQFPSLRLTMGKTRIGWGDGQVFNAGDVLYGSLDPAADLTAEEIRSDTALLTLVRLSGGRSYAEAIVMAPETDWTNPLAPVSPSLTATSAGGRFVTEILGATVEAGYLCKGQARTGGDETGHRPYLSLHGYGWLDWYGSVSLAVPFQDATWEDNIKETIHVSGGAFRQFGLGYDGTLSARLEALVYQTGDYYLYPELAFGLGQNLTIPLMAVYSGPDESVQITTGFSWNVYQGFRFLGYAVAGLGDSGDTFSTGDLAFSAGMSYIY